MREEVAKLDGVSLFLVRRNEEILKDVSFSLSEGELIVIRGPTGSGKSLLLKSIAGSNLQGIKVRGKIKTIHEKIRVPQDPSSLLLTPSVRTLLSFHDFEKASRLLEYFGKEELLHRKTYHLSYGEKKIITLLHALTSSSKLLLLDEPFSGLDSRRRETLKWIIDEERKRGRSFIIVDHTASPFENGKILYISTAEKRITRQKRKHRRELPPLRNSKNGRELLKINKITVKVDGKEILKNLSFTLNEGELKFISGENGTGKTTLLHAISGWGKNAEGEINYRGKKWKKKDRKKKTFFLSQTPESSFFSLNMDYMSRRSGIPEEKIERSSLEKLKGIPSIYWSYGEKVKFNLLLADSSEAEIIMIDETFSSLDYKSLLFLYQNLNRWLNENRGIIITTPETGTSFEGVNLDR